MHFVLRQDKLVGKGEHEHVHFSVFAAHSAFQTPALLGTLCGSIGEWQMLGACLRMAADASEGNVTLQINELAGEDES